MTRIRSIAQRVATWLGPESHERSLYRDREAPVQRRNMGLVAAINLVLSPFYFWNDVRWVRIGAMTAEMATNYVLVHVWVVAISVVYLLYLALTRRFGVVTAYGHRFVTWSAAHLILVASVLAILNQFGSGSVTIFVTAALGTVVVARARPLWVISWTVGGGMAVVTSAWVLHDDPSLVLTGQLNVLLAAAAVAVFYPYYDRLRFQAFMQRREMARLLSVKEAILRALGHDLRAPVIEMRRLARVLEDPHVDWDRERPATIDRLEGVVEHTSLVIDNVTAAGSDGPVGGSTDAVASLSECFERAVRLVERPAARKSTTLIVDVEDDVMVVGDMGRIVFVLHNLLHNAVKFTPDERSIVLAASIGRDVVQVSVTDEGLGFAPHALESVHRGEWKSGSHGTRGEQGTGLGLGVVQPLLASLGTSLQIETRVGAGTTVRFDLKRYRDDPHAGASAVRSLRSFRFRRPTRFSRSESST